VQTQSDAKIFVNHMLLLQDIYWSDLLCYLFSVTYLFLRVSLKIYGRDFILDFFKCLCCVVVPEWKREKSLAVQLNIDSDHENYSIWLLITYNNLTRWCYHAWMREKSLPPLVLIGHPFYIYTFLRKFNFISK
jgi:hypothetical protein